jgi:hypothetical protein
MLRDAMQRLRAPGTQGTSAPGLTALGWAYIDTGRWDEAQEAAAEAADLAEANQMDLVAASADLIAATVLAMRADSGAARRHAGRALASDGLTNREIGDRLFLSPRTVSSHLYRSYPKLGVADRHQLRDVIARASTPAPAHESAGNERLRFSSPGNRT